MIEGLGGRSCEFDMSEVQSLCSAQLGSGIASRQCSHMKTKTLGKMEKKATQKFYWFPIKSKACFYLSSTQKQVKNFLQTNIQ